MKQFPWKQKSDWTGQLCTAFGLLVILPGGVSADVVSSPDFATSTDHVNASKSDDRHFSSEERIKDLVRQLGADTFRSRESATNMLIRIGTPAKADVERGLNDADIEISSRCELIIAEIGERERRELMARFLADGVDARSLPGWDRFTAVVGNGPQVKSLYSKMLREEWVFIEKVIRSEQQVKASIVSAHVPTPANGAADGYDPASQYLANRCIMVQNLMRTNRSSIKEGTLCALLFAASLPEIEMAHPSVLMGFCTRNECQRYFFTGEHREILLSLLSKVILKPQGESTLAQRMFLAARYGLRDGVQLARATIRDASVRTYVRQSAILLIARFGNEDDFPALERLLDDQTVSIPARKVQIRDIALATLIHLHGKDPREYGFATARREDMMVYSASTLGFPTDAAREDAFARWAQRESK